MTSSPTNKESDKSNIVFENKLITPMELAKKLNEDQSSLLKELKEEKGIFEDAMTKTTVLAWDTVQRACERRGIEAIESPQEYLTNTEKATDNKISLTPEEKKVLQYCRDFHKEYSTLIENAVPPGMEAKSELSEYHRNISSSIQNVLNKVQSKSKNKKNLEDLNKDNGFDGLGGLGSL